MKTKHNKEYKIHSKLFCKQWSLINVHCFVIIFRKDYTQTQDKNTSIQGYRAFRESFPRLISLPFAGGCQSLQPGNRKGKWLYTWITLCYHSVFSSLFNGLFSLYLRKDYRLENEFRKLKESSLGNLNKIEPKIKLSGLPLFQSCPLEHTLIKQFLSVILSDFSWVFLIQRATFHSW